MLCYRIEAEMKYEFPVFGKLKRSGDARTALGDFDYPTNRYRRRVGPSIIPIHGVLRVLGIKYRWILLEKTYKGWHATIRLDRALSPSEMVALQFAIGSDKRRETLNLRRAICARRWHPRMNILFERKLDE